jgi:hypothetical protein
MSVRGPGQNRAFGGVRGMPDLGPAAALKRVDAVVNDPRRGRAANFGARAVTVDELLALAERARAGERINLLPVIVHERVVIEKRPRTPEPGEWVEPDEVVEITDDQPAVVWLRERGLLGAGEGEG